jgi:hypothetical protein
MIFPGILCTRNIHEALNNVQYNILVRKFYGRLSVKLSVELDCIA